MKRMSPAIAVLLAGTLQLRADLTLEQTMDAGELSGQIVMRIKGDRFRTDIPGGARGPLSTIMDAKSGDVTTLIHEKKISITRRGGNPAAAEADSGKAADAPKPTPTNRTERVGQYETDVYTMRADDSLVTLWVAKAFPNFAAIRKDLQRVSRASADGANRPSMLDVTTLPGMVVKRQKERDGQQMTITLTKASREPIDDAVFEIPAGYKPVNPPPVRSEK
jgi:Domain of unknown function (DUF4412)